MPSIRRRMCSPLTKVRSLDDNHITRLTGLMCADVGVTDALHACFFFCRVHQGCRRKRACICGCFPRLAGVSLARRICLHWDAGQHFCVFAAASTRV